MYELVMDILKKSGAENVDIGVAYDMLAVDGNREELKKAHEILLVQSYYKAITGLRNVGRLAEVRVICDMYEAGEDKSKIKEYVQTLIDNGILIEY